MHLLGIRFTLNPFDPFREVVMIEPRLQVGCVLAGVHILVYCPDFLNGHCDECCSLFQGWSILLKVTKEPVDVKSRISPADVLLLGVNKHFFLVRQSRVRVGMHVAVAPMD